MHLALTWDDVTNTGIVKLYENGVQVASLATSTRMASINDVNNWLGRSSFSSDANLQGGVTEFRIYNRILSPAEVLNDYQLGPAFAGSVIKWNGQLSQNWDVNTTSNWRAGAASVKYQNGVAVQFDDTLSGATNVIITTTVQPGAVTVSNSVYNYVFSGSGGIGGSAGLTKAGTGVLYLNENNTYTGTSLINSGVFGGTGNLAGPVSVASGAELAPGTASIGTLTINNRLTLGANSTTFMKVSLDGGVTNNDQVAGLTGVSYAGTLLITNIGAAPLAGGTQFQLFASSSAGLGNFDAVNILPTGSGTFDPNTGVVTIAPGLPPTLNPPVISAGNLILTGTGGTPLGTYTVLTATNVALPLVDWTTNATGQFDAGGSFSNGITILQNEPGRFFLIKTR